MNMFGPLTNFSSSLPTTGNDLPQYTTVYSLIHVTPLLIPYAHIHWELQPAALMVM